MGRHETIQEGINVIVWSYWDGDKPAYVRECERTIYLNADNFLCLNDLYWDRMWIDNRDIDLSRLTLPQKSDFIRAYLLKTYGGLWTDIDCVAIRPIEPLMDGIKWHKREFIGYIETGNSVASGMIASMKAGNVITRAFDEQKKIIASKRPLKWMTLAHCFNNAVRDLKHEAYFHEIEKVRVMPICWQHPEKFFEKCGPFDHCNKIDSKTILYMMAAESIRRNPELKPEVLLHGDTFWYYLIMLGRKRDQMNDFWGHYYHSFLEDIPSWFCKDEAAWLSRWISPGDVCVDVGVSRGKSAATMALMSNKVYAVSNWDNPPEGDQHEFELRMQKIGAKQNITTIALPSVEAARMMKGKGIKPDVVFIDAAHDEANVTADIAEWRDVVKPGGILAFHDCASKDHPGVAIAVNKHMDWHCLGEVRSTRVYRKPK
jgi:hypothetical protein